MTAALTRWSDAVTRCAHMTCEPAATELRKVAEEMRKEIERLRANQRSEQRDG